MGQRGKEEKQIRTPDFNHNDKLFALNHYDRAIYVLALVSGKFLQIHDATLWYRYTCELFEGKDK